MTIRKRGSAFMVDVKVGASQNPTKREIRTRVTVKDMQTARRLEAEIRASIMKHGSWTPDTVEDMPKASRKSRAVGTLSAALEEAWNYPSGRNRGWKYQKAGEHQYNKAKACIDILGPERHCGSVTADDVEMLTTHFHKQGNAPSTINYKIQALFRVLWHAQRKGWITHRPVWERAMVNNAREFIFDLPFEQKVIKYFEEDQQDFVMRDMFILGIETGLRLSELLTSTVSSWNVKERVITVRADNSKSGRLRVVTLTPRAIETITPYLKNREHDWRIFRWTKGAVARKMRRARKHFGMADEFEFCFHSTRHTRATRLARATRDPFVVMAQLGHSNVNTSMRYIKMAALDVSAATTPVPEAAASLSYPNVSELEPA